ncbi:MAG: hypothetical protein AAFO58_10770, partial [Pseudomonadota bacterium]
CCPAQGFRRRKSRQPARAAIERAVVEATAQNRDTTLKANNAQEARAVRGHDADAFHALVYERPTFCL